MIIIINFRKKTGLASPLLSSVWQLAQVVLIHLRTVGTKELHSNNHRVLGVHALFYLDHKCR